MKERAGMPYDVVAYEADEIARTLNETEEGLFHRMMRLAWMNGSIPADPAKLAPLLRTRPSILKKAWPKLSQLWVPCGENSERLRNKKQESERDFVEKKRVKAETSANLRWKNKKVKEVVDANAVRTECDGNPSPPLPVPPLPNKEEKKRKEHGEGDRGNRRVAPAYTDEFEIFWESSSKRGPKLDAFAEWRLLHPSDNLIAIIHKSMQAWLKSEQWEVVKFRPYVHRWLKKRGWENMPHDEAVIAITGPTLHQAHTCVACGEPHSWKCLYHGTTMNCGMTQGVSCPEFMETYNARTEAHS